MKKKNYIKQNIDSLFSAAQTTDAMREVCNLQIQFVIAEALTTICEQLNEIKNKM